MMKTIKLYIVTLATLLLMPAATAWGQVAEISGVGQYETLTAAFTAVGDNKTIILLDNITISEEVVVPTGKTFTLDLGGKELTVSSQNGINFKNDNTANSSLTIKNGTITGNDNCTNAVVRLGGQGNTLTIASDAIINNQGGSTTIAVMQDNVTSPNKNTLNVYGTVSATDFESSNVGTPAISSNGIYTKSADINIYDGATITSAKGAGVYVPGKTGTTCNITGGTITGASGVYVKAGTLNISGGTINGTGEQVAYVYYGNGAKCTGDALVVENSNYGNNGAPTVSVTGGTFNSTNAQAVASYNYGSNNQVTGFVSGGSFSSQVPADFLATGSLIGIDENGDYVVVSSQNAVAVVGDTNYATLAAAIAAAEAISGGGTVTLLADINVTAQVKVSGKVTLELSGKTIAYTGTETLTTGVIGVKRGANLTIRDIGGNNSGKIDSGAKAYAAVAVTIPGETATGDVAELTVQGGTLIGDYYAITGNGNRNGTKITISGGVIKGNHANDNLGIYHPQNGELTISGGQITGYSSAVELRSGTLTITGGEFTTTATTYSCTPNGNGTTTVGAAVAIAQHTTNQPINATISGGTFNASGDAKKLSVSNPQNNAFNNVSVSGLTDLIGNSNVIPDGYYWLESNGVSTLTKYAASITANNTTTYYTTLEAAFSALTSHATVNLLDNIDLNGADITCNLEDGNWFTLNFNGNTVAGGSILLPTNVQVITDQQTTIFAPLNSTTDEVTETPSDTNYIYTAVPQSTPDYVASIGDTNYTDLASAITAVTNGCTVTLLKDIVVDADITCPLTTGQSFTIGYGTHTLTASNGKAIKLATGVMVKTMRDLTNTGSTDPFVAASTGSKVIAGKTGSDDATTAYYAYYAATLAAEPIPYVNAAGVNTTTGDAVVVVLDSNMDNFTYITDGGWYVASNNVTLHQVRSIGKDDADTHIILVDGKTLILNAITGSCNYTFYGQSGQTGKLELIQAFDIYNTGTIRTLTQNGGIITTYSTGGSIPPRITGNVVVNNGTMNITSSSTREILGVSNDANSSIVINGGKVTIVNTTDNGVAMRAGTITITGGQVEARGTHGMVELTGSTITLGLSNVDDYIIASTYEGTVQIANGKTLYDTDAGNTAYTGTLDTDQKIAIAGHTLRASATMSINDPSITVTVEPATYTGAAITPVVTVSGASGALVKDQDYEISFDGTYTNAKTYSNAITITGIGGYYTGTRKADFVISPRNINDVTVTGNTQAYTGSAYSADDIKAPVVLKFTTTTGSTETTTTLHPSDANNTNDYTISVADGTYQAPGTYQGVITLTAVEGEGKNYVGSRTVDFIISDATNLADCDVTISPLVYNGSAQAPTGGTNVKVMRGANEISSTEYEITYNGTGTADYINAATYPIKISAKSGSSVCFGSKVVNYVISPKDINTCSVTAEANFTGSDITPTAEGANANVIVTDPGRSNAQLTYSTDFTMTVQSQMYHDPQIYANAITITGQGNYSGTKSANFVITNNGATNLADGKLLVTSKAIYTGVAQVPSASTVTVLYNGSELAAANYTLTYAPDTYIDAQTYSGAITITAQGASYYGSVTADYVIAPRNMNEVTATEVNKMNWTGSPITPNINTSDNNNVSLYYANYYLKSANPIDYTCIVEPSSIVDPGVYTITFEGRGNFTGTKRLEVHVVKDLSSALVQAGISWAQDIVILSEDGTAFTAGDLVVKDGNATMNSEDFTAKIYEDSGCATEVTTGISSSSIPDDKPGYIYYVKLTGKNISDPDAIYINSTDAKPLVVLKPYQTGEMNNKYGGTLNVNLHLTDVTSSAAVNASLGNNGNPVINSTASEEIALTVPGSVTYTLNDKAASATDITITASITGIETGAFTDCTNLKGLDLFAASGITEVQNGAFEGCTALRYIDLSNAAGFTPSSLQRNIEASPFNGVPKQALVYLNGSTFTGENYVYKPGTEEKYYCEVFKIYDDMGGDQTGFTENKGYQWAFENVHPFRAYTLTNTRQLLAERHYTTCLPYALPIPNNVKAYTLEATSDKLFGFKEVTGTLAARTPYVLIPTASGQLLSSTNIDVPVFTETDAAAKELTPTTTTGSNSFEMCGTMRYMEGNDATGKFIMQYNGGNPTWKQITSSPGFNNDPNKACILPMRAYIMPYIGSGSRERMGVGFTNLDGSTTVYDLDDLMFDGEDSVYDLQGRKRQNVQRGGLYIKNGKKVVVKTK